MRHLLLLVCCVVVSQAAELLQNTTLAAGSTPWNLPAGVATVVDGKPLGAEGAVLRIAADTTGWHMANQWGIPLPAGITRLRLSAHVRTEGIKRGADGWSQPRLMVMFHDAAGTQKGTVGAVDIGDAVGWRDVSGVVEVPAGTASIAFCVGLHQCSGTMLVTHPSCQTAE